MTDTTCTDVHASHFTSCIEAINQSEKIDSLTEGNQKYIKVTPFLSYNRKVCYNGKDCNIMTA